jgi:plasmid stabilization system protein ParE
MSKYVIGPEARADLNDIWEYIAQDDSDAADRWAAKLREAIEFLARTPGAGHAWKDLTELSVFSGLLALISLYIGLTTESSRLPQLLRARAT